MKIFLLLFLGLALSACTSTEVIESVSNNDWEALGQYDGKNGLIKKNEKQLITLSKQYGNQTIDAEAYSSSYKTGLDKYCILSNAYILGVMRKPYYGVCEKYEHGWKFYENWISGRHSQASSM